MLPRLARPRAARPTRRARRVAFGAAGAAALAGSTALGWHPAYAGFTDRTVPLSTSPTTGTVVLADDAGTAMFTMSEWAPGASVYYRVFSPDEVAGRYLAGKQPSTKQEALLSRR